MATTLANLIVSCRILSGDGASDNLRRSENLNNAELNNVVNGANTLFYLENVPVASVNVVHVDNSLIAPSGYVLDAVNGTITFTTAPITSVYVTYNYYLFNDAIWTEIITAAIEKVNQSTGNPTNDATNIPEGMLASVKVLANAFYNQKIASQTGLWFNRKLQERSDDRDNVSSKYAKMADMAFNRGKKLLDEFYEDRSDVPAFRIVEHQPLPWTPAR